jgi:hypothetical protein
MQYTKSIPFYGDTGRAFDLAMSSLTSLGFRVVSRDETRMDLVGPGMNNNRQSALLGASRLRLTRGFEELSVRAELGGVQTMARFVTIFPVALVLVLGIISIVLRTIQHGGQLPLRASLIPVMAAVAPNAVLWLFLGPWMARRIGRQTCAAIDALLNNMAVAGRSS